MNLHRPIVDLFAGPGGWSEGLRALGLSELGIEWDETACLTARAAGHERLQADVSKLDPDPNYPCTGLIASPPCQAWSMAGKGGGRRDKELCVRAALELAAGNDTRAERAAECEDPRSILVVEPLRWALALRPEWIALEQVPPALEMWTLIAQLLEAQGYKVWAGVLEAERYGVPQTRERAVLMASRVSEVHPPRATHQRYVFGEPRRHDVTLEGEIVPWVSMAEALGWEEGPSPSPSPSVTGGGGSHGGIEVYASKAARRRAARAVTIPTGYDRRQGATNRETGVRTMVRVVSIDEPAPTIGAQGLATGRDVWVYDRPATTIAGDPRVFQPGGHHTPGAQSENAVRVTVAQAAALQSFRPDYPWQGTRNKQHEQVGNAVPPLLARAILAALIPDINAKAGGGG